MVRSAKLGELGPVLVLYRSILLRVTAAKRWLYETRNGHLSAQAVLMSWATAEDKRHVAQLIREHEAHR